MKKYLILSLLLVPVAVFAFKPAAVSLATRVAKLEIRVSILEKQIALLQQEKSDTGMRAFLDCVSRKPYSSTNWSPDFNVNNNWQGCKDAYIK